MSDMIIFDMTRQQHPLYGTSSALLKRWTKYSIYAKSGSYNRTDNPRDNLYSTNSIYLYDYILVSEAWYTQMVYTASVYDNTPSADSDYSYSAAFNADDWQVDNKWLHKANTFKNSPNATTNNYILTQNLVKSITHSLHNGTGTGHPYFELPPIFRDDGVYFEIVQKYPRNHFTHKKDLFSLWRMTSYGFVNRTVTSGSYSRNSQTIDSTVGTNGLEDGTSPVQSTPVGNLNLVQTTNVINQ